MTVISAKDAKDRLDELLTASAKGEEVLIAREDGHMFKLTLTATQTKKKRGGLGIAKGQIWMSDDFDALPEGFEDYLP